jgi:hypothetical protein
MNDIANTSVRIQTSAEDRLLREESKIGEVFFVPSCYAPKASNVRHVEPSREETLHPLCRAHMNTKSARRDLAASPFSHHPTIDKECFS